jgi:hypothetical protein
MSGLNDQWFMFEFFSVVFVVACLDGGNLTGILLFLGWCVVILG